MLSVPLSLTCRSSSILASSSAIGFSKSRKVRIGPGAAPSQAKAAGTAGPWPPVPEMSTAAPAQRMMIRHQGLEPRHRDVGVDLRGRDVGVAEHLLHAAQIGAALGQIGR